MLSKIRVFYDFQLNLNIESTASSWLDIGYWISNNEPDANFTFVFTTFSEVKTFDIIQESPYSIFG